MRFGKYIEIRSNSYKKMNINEYINRVDNAYENFKEEKLLKEIESILYEVVNKYGAESIEYCSLLNELGSCERGQRKLDKAEQHYIEALNIMGRVTGKENADYATTLNNLAGTHRFMGKTGKAVQEFYECLNIYVSTVGRENSLYAAGLNNLALVYLQKKDI